MTEPVVMSARPADTPPSDSGDIRAVPVGDSCTDKLKYYGDIGFRCYKLVFVSFAIVWVALTASSVLSYDQKFIDACAMTVQHMENSYANATGNAPAVSCSDKMCPSKEPPVTSNTCRNPLDPVIDLGTAVCCDNGFSCHTDSSVYSIADTGFGGINSLQLFFQSRNLAVFSPCSVPQSFSLDSVGDGLCGPKPFWTISCNNGTDTDCSTYGVGCGFGTCNGVGPVTCTPTGYATLIWAMAIVALVGESLRQLLGMFIWCRFGNIHASHFPRSKAEVVDLCFENGLFGLNLLFRPGLAYAYFRDPEGGIGLIRMIQKRNQEPGSTKPLVPVERAELPYGLELFLLIGAAFPFAALSLLLAFFQKAAGFAIFKCIISFSVAILKVLVLCGRQARADVAAYHDLRLGGTAADDKDKPSTVPYQAA